MVDDGEQRFFSNISFKLTNKIGNLALFDGQSITFRLSIKKN